MQPSWMVCANFYPRPPRGGRLIVHVGPRVVAVISIHALREEGDRASVGGFFVCLISIHALREEGDESFRTQRSGPNTFLSTPSARRAT